MQNSPSNKFLTYEPIINRLTYLYQNNNLADKFSLDSDINQRLNTQIIIDDNNEKLMNTNIVRRVNAKGSCGYKKDDPYAQNINFDKKILKQAYSPVENYALLIVYNCIYSYNGNIAKKK